MAVHNDILYAGIDELYLDPRNPRLGRSITSKNLAQEDVLKEMLDWSLDELALSFLQNGFWPQEAIIVVTDDLYGEQVSVVVEGNRRLAALKLLRDASVGRPLSRKWAQLIEENGAPDANLFERVPYIEADERSDVSGFIGFRHVAGIAEWAPAEKAEYISRLIDDEGLSYHDVMRKIGSKTPIVRQNYIAYRLLLQMEDSDEIDVERVENKFSVLYLSLRTQGTQTFLSIDVGAQPGEAERPVPQGHLENLKDFALWLFGNDRKAAIVPESRDVDRFGRILANEEAVDYLRRSESPSFEAAYRIAGGDEPEVVRMLDRAADQIEEALGRVHHYRESDKISRAVRRCSLGHEPINGIPESAVI